MSADPAFGHRQRCGLRVAIYSSISGIISENDGGDQKMPKRLWPARAWVSRQVICAPMSSALLGSSNKSVSVMTSARAMSVRLASPDDMCATGRRKYG